MDKIGFDATYGALSLACMGCRSAVEEQLESWTPDNAITSGHAARSPCFSMLLGHLSLQMFVTKEREERKGVVEGKRVP